MNPTGHVTPARVAFSQQAAPECSGERTNALGFAVLILLATLPYLNTLFNGFVYDDTTQVLSNPYIKNIRFLPRIFKTSVWSFIGAQGVTNYYRPMMTLGYLICYQLFGPIAYGFHLANLCVHVGATLLVFAVTFKLFQDRTLAWVAAGIFAIHPIHSEPVAWIAAITDLEVTFFYLLTFWLFLELPASGGGRRPWIKLAMVASFVLTIFSKEQSLTFPLVATIYEHIYREDRGTTSLTQKVARYGDLWLMDFAYVLFRVRFLGAFAPQRQLAHMPFSEIMLSAFALVGHYAGKLLWPAHFCAYYVFRKSSTVMDPRVIYGLATIAICLILFLAAWKTARMVSFGIVWIAVTLAPVLDAHLMSGAVFAERYLYLPSAGFAWLAGWGALRLWKMESMRARRGRRFAMAAAGAVIVALSMVRIITRNKIWRTDLILYADTLKTSPDATVILNNLGAALWNRGDSGRAEKDWLEALKIEPRNPIVLLNLGLLYSREGDYERAEQVVRRAMLDKPLYTGPHKNLGGLYEMQGDLSDAELQFRAASLLSPLDPSAQNTLGWLYLEEGALDAAELKFRDSEKGAPNNDGYDGLADVLRTKGDWRGAERMYRQAVELDPFDSHAHFGIAQIARSRGEDKLALKEYQRGLDSDPLNPEALKAIQQLKSHVGDGHETKP